MKITGCTLLFFLLIVAFGCAGDKSASAGHAIEKAREYCKERGGVDVVKVGPSSNYQYVRCRDGTRNEFT